MIQEDVTRNLVASFFIAEEKVMDLTKKKRLRLTGKKLEALNRRIHERDNYRCIIPGCSAPVPFREKFHHEPCGAYKEDVEEKGCCLCYTHHQLRESKNGAAEIKDACNEYLNNLYPGRKAKC